MFPIMISLQLCMERRIVYFSTEVILFQLQKCLRSHKCEGNSTAEDDNSAEVSLENPNFSVTL